MKRLTREERRALVRAGKMTSSHAVGAWRSDGGRVRFSPLSSAGHPMRAPRTRVRRTPDHHPRVVRRTR